MDVIDFVNQRIVELKEGVIKLQNMANAHLGAIQELERLKAEIEKQRNGEQNGDKKTNQI